MAAPYWPHTVGRIITSPVVLLLLLVFSSHFGGSAAPPPISALLASSRPRAGPPANLGLPLLRAAACCFGRSQAAPLALRRRRDAAARQGLSRRGKLYGMLKSHRAPFSLVFFFSWNSAARASPNQYTGPITRGYASMAFLLFFTILLTEKRKPRIHWPPGCRLAPVRSRCEALRALCALPPRAQ